MISKFFNWLFSKRKSLQVHNAAPEHKVSFYYMQIQDGHHLFEYDPESDAINEKTDFVMRKYENKTCIEFEVKGKCIYISALNKRNARNKINKYLRK